jgi:ATPase, P-type (transporting), HAD superfamily, subfamily IC
MKKSRANVETVVHFNPNLKEGLSTEQVNERKAQLLDNKVKDVTNTQYIDIIIRNVFTFYNVLLFIIGGFLLAAKQYTNCFFLIVVITNTIINLVQDFKAKNKLQKLSLINENKIEVIRDSKISKISVDDIVLDDILHLKAGDQIPCDSFVLSGDADVDESILTGESLPLHKIAGTKLLSGSYLLNGDLYIKVTSVGKDNYAYKIQSKTKDFKAPKSQMFIQLNNLFKGISAVVILLGIATVISKGLTASAFNGWDNFLKNVAPIAGALISMIPSGMYLLISTTLTVGVINLSTKKVLVQDMYSIETLARVDTLCIDKTGTITTGKMSVYDVILLNEEFKKEKFDVVMSSFNAAINDSNFTAIALEDKFGKKAVYDSKRIVQFDSHKKYSSASLNEIGTITVGAYGFVPLKEDGKVKKEVDKYSELGYRVLVVGYSKEEIKERKSPSEMTPLAIIIMQDCLRDNAKEIIGWFIKNGVNIKVISGDNPLTVKEIAGTVGIENSDKYISLLGLSEEEVKAAASKYNIFGRVSPEQKEILVRELKEEKHTVAMFGDGVNDLLALKASNVGITVGCANKAAKDLASIILYSDDFGSLPDVIAAGRREINNLQRVCSLFLTKTLFAIVVNIFFLVTAMTINLSYPFKPQHFYGWDVVGIGIAAFFLALEKNNDEIVKGSFLKNIFKNATVNGLVMAIEVMVLFIYSYNKKMLPESMVTLAVYFMSIASFIPLFEVSVPFDGYRTIVYIGSFVATTLMFIFTYVSGFNVLGLNLSVDYRTILPNVGMMIGAFLFVWLLVYLTPRIIKKIKEKKHD